MIIGLIWFYCVLSAILLTNAGVSAVGLVRGTQNPWFALPIIVVSVSVAIFDLSRVFVLSAQGGEHGNQDDGGRGL